MRNLTTIRTAGLSLLAAAALASCSLFASYGDEDPRGFYKQASISLPEAIEAAVGVQSGRIVEADLEHDETSGELVYDIDMLGVDGVYQVLVDPRTGAVIRQGLDDDSDAEFERFRTALRATGMPLEALLKKAMAATAGVPVSIELESDDDGVECEVVFVRGKDLVEVELDPATGVVVETETVDGSDDDDDADDGDEDDDDGN